MVRSFLQIAEDACVRDMTCFVVNTLTDVLGQYDIAPFECDKQRSSYLLRW